MHTTRLHDATRNIIVGVLILLSSLSAARSADSASEQEQLAALARQLDLADRLASQAATLSPDTRRRYHLDYSALRADLHRVRAGVQDYLVPQRAQPRDPVPLIGSYSHDGGRASDEEPPP
ncbi:raqprd family integrative conjugative element protein [Rahnella sp. CG8]|uniref:integrative conjugative element protein, RAQPRD family n=1 Tax=Yersiniaceae TaxID=1903411 RepID=UPI001013C9BA|nr:MULTISPECIES: RAQPRD family integrative conjugative element protein [Yersiniaceae]MCM2446226.1 raqprd family integrative conjugative element protein [Rahnella sp. CG8]